MIDSESVFATLPKPDHINGAYDDYTVADIEWIACQFQIVGEVSVAPFPGKGNINLHTYEVSVEDSKYLLQKVNSAVFTMPHRVMNSMLASIEAQVAALKTKSNDLGWVPIELVPTTSGQPYLDLTDAHGSNVWRLMVKIPESISFKSLAEVEDREKQLALAYEVGRGMAIYSDLTAGIEPSQVEGALPGYRNTAIYYAQFHSVCSENRTIDQALALMPVDPIDRASTEAHFLVEADPATYHQRMSDPDLVPFIVLAKEKEPFAMALWDAVRDGTIRHTLIHGDTKLENFLFDQSTGRVKSLVDLDTTMAFTWLADWGDCLRSMVNVAGEKETDLSKVQVDEGIFEAVAKGFLTSATQVTQPEIARMVSSIQAITLELGLRFLTDYLRGDTYFRLAESDPPDLNKTRALVQLTLYQRMSNFSGRAEKIITQYASAPTK
jgi:Phosphotransferase enzyme family